MKKTFSLRLEESEINRFKALAAVLAFDSQELMKEMLSKQEKILTEKQLKAYEALLKCWNSNK